MMSCNIQPPSIEHIDHAWELQGNLSDLSLAMAIRGLDQLVRINDSRYFEIHTTYKVDDAMSAKVRRFGGKLQVGYKGRNSPWLSSIEEIEHHYSSKPYVADKLRVLLLHGDDIAGDVDNVSYQVGFMDYNPDGLNEVITPNVVQYKLEDVTSQKLAVVVVSKCMIGDRISFIHPDTRQHTDNVYFYDNSFVFDGEVDRIFENRLDTSKELLRGLIGSHLIYRIAHSDIINQYMRNSWRNCAQSNITDFIKFLESVSEKERGAVKRQDSKDRISKKYNDILDWVMMKPNYHAYSDAISLLDILQHTCSSFVESLGRDMEGLVMTRYNNDGTISALKVIDRNFTLRNNQRWKEQVTP